MTAPSTTPAPSVPPVGPPESPALGAGSSRLLPLCAIVALVLHLVFTKLLAHFLPRADFGAIVASQIFLFAAAFPAFALQAASAAFAFAQRGVGKPVSPVESFDRIAARVAIIAFVLALVGYFLPLPKFFQLPSPSFGAAAPLLAATALLEAIASGTLLGARCERSFAAAIVASPLLRLVLTAVFIACGFGSFAAVFAILVASTIVAVAARARLARSIAAKAPDPESARRGRARSPFSVFRGATTIAALFGFGILAHFDTMIVRTRLSVDDAGGYAGVAVIGRLGLLLTLPLALFLVLRVRRALVEKRATFPYLFRALLLTAVIQGSIVAIATFVPEVPISIFLDHAIYADLVPLLQRYTIAMGLLAFAQVLLFYGIAHDRMPLYLLPIAAVPLGIRLFVNKGRELESAVLVAEAQALLFTAILAGAIAILSIVLPWASKKLLKSAENNAITRIRNRSRERK